jgi:hypothetical protein
MRDYRTVNGLTGKCCAVRGTLSGMTTDSKVPADAITAAGNALRKRWLAEFPGIGGMTLDPMDWAATAVEAAAPLIAAAEREACARLAAEHKPTFWDPTAGGDRGGWRFFADLLRAR